MSRHKHYWAGFERFSFKLPAACVMECSGPGQKDAMVKYWTQLLDLKLPADKLRSELKEYGAWEESELADHDTNLERIIWLAACQIYEERKGKV